MGNLHIIQAVLAFFEKKSRYKNRAHTTIYYFRCGVCTRKREEQKSKTDKLTVAWFVPVSRFDVNVGFARGK